MTGDRERARRAMAGLVAIVVAVAVAVPAAAVPAGDIAAIAKKKCKKGKGKSAVAAKKCKKKKKQPVTPPPATPAQLTITPTSHNYGLVDPAAGPAGKAFEIKNVGGVITGPPTETLQDNSVVGAAPTPSLAISSNTCNAGVAPMASCQVVVQFDPFLFAVTASGTLTVEASPGGTVVATMSGVS